MLTLSALCDVLLAPQIRSLAPLTQLAMDPAARPALRELFCAANKVAAIEGLSAFTGLTLLELGSNRIRSTEGLEVKCSWQASYCPSSIFVTCTDFDEQSQ